MEVLETCLYGKDLEAMRRFYEKIVGLECFVFKPPRQAFFRTERGVVLVFNPEETRHSEKLPPHGAEGSVHICFRLGDKSVDWWKNRLERKGFETSKASWPAGESLYTNDPCGNLIEFAPAKIWGIE